MSRRHLVRSSGILLHITSLPGRYGVGDLGPEAYRFVDFLTQGKQSLWQVLPLGPTSSGNFHSPYVALSAFAGNPLFISLETLVTDGLLPRSTLNSLSSLPEGFADYDAAGAGKLALLRMATDRFHDDAPASWRSAFTEFCNRQQWWLDDYALFMALRTQFQDASWHIWEPPGLVQREPTAVHAWRDQLRADIHFHQLTQFLFFTQWERLKGYANEHGVKIIGDIPIYVGFDSAEVWAHPELFELHPETRTPQFVAGVPPDYFSETGQRWGNPLYRWREENGQPVLAVHDWWVRRFRSTFALVDILRVDHFRGFEAYWSIPEEEETAVKGQWILGPGATLFSTLQEKLGELPVIAEDLGVITPEVDALRLQFEFPGMKVLQFAFGGDAHNPYLPHNYNDLNCVVYTGTHDNDTMLGWFRSASVECREHVLRYLDRKDETEISWEMIRLAWRSVAASAIAPMQDILSLGSEGRMNIPGQPEGNWRWRYLPDALDSIVSARLAKLTSLYGRDEG